MTTFVLTRESFVTRARTSDNSAEDLAAKLTELDGRFNQHYIGETDYETSGEIRHVGVSRGHGRQIRRLLHRRRVQGDDERLLRGFRGDRRIRHLQFRIRRDTDRRDFPDSPALAAGLEIGDLIAYIGIGENRESVAEIGYDAALTKLRGAAGTTAGTHRSPRRKLRNRSGILHRARALLPNRPSSLAFIRRTQASA